MMTIDRYLGNYVTDQAIPLYAITGADDFEHALPSWQPKELMPGAKRIVVFGRQFI